MPVLNTAALIGWSCPVNLAASPPQPDADGSRLLVHVQDNAGNDFEIRCVKSLTGFFYEYRISFPDGTSKELSQCVYSLGLNDVSLIYQGAMSQVTAPNGTPVINVGAILIVEHSNVEAKGNAVSGLTPKPGGDDFHIVYDYRQKLRYRLNTKVGEGVTGTDYLDSRAFSPAHMIVRAEATQVRSSADFDRAIAGDTDFRKLDDRKAKPPGEGYEFQDADTDDSPIGYVYLEERERSGAVLLDPSVRGSSFMLVSRGVEGRIPASPGRTRSTLAIERRLFTNGAKAVVVTVDGRRSTRARLVPSDSMIVVDIGLNEASHRLRLIEAVRRGSAVRSKPPAKKRSKRTPGKPMKQRRPHE